MEKIITDNIKLYKGDCLEIMDILIKQKSEIDCVLTDIPYDGVNRIDNGLRNLDKGKADIITFDLHGFLERVYKLSKGSIIIFCGHNQYSEIFNFFKDKKGTTRGLVWHKTNPSPMNGKHIYLSSFEVAIWFKKRGATFNGFCKHNVFNFPSGRSKFHPTQKNEKLFEELLFDNTKIGDVVLDTCMGSGTTGIVSVKNNRKFIGIELNDEYFEIAYNRINGYIYE